MPAPQETATPVARESMDYDLVIVGGGPAGLAAAFRFKQLLPESSVCILEKGSEIGAHILSGAVIDPRALNELIPDWKEKGAPLDTAVADDRFCFFTKGSAITIPHFLFPPLMSNRGNYIVSLSNLCKWLGQQAEALGVEIYPGFPAHELLIEDGVVRGVITGDLGSRQGRSPQGQLHAGHGTARASTPCSRRARAARCQNSWAWSSSCMKGASRRSSASG